MHGELSEKEFAALHELKKEAPPKPTGTMVEVGEAAHYLALPKDKKAPLPAVIVIHEWYGLNDHIKHWADRLAGEGCAALAVDLYRGTVAKTSEEAQKAMGAVDAAQATATLREAFAFLSSDDRIKATKRGCIGWCFGGGWSLKLAIAERDLDACVIYYGRLVDDEAELAKIEAPVLGVFGSKDRSIPEQAVAAFEGSMKKLGKDVRVLRYDAEHAFANPSGARYDQKNAAAAWTEARAFLQKHLGGKAAEATGEKPAGKPGEKK
ncbi:MAG TPA: dienelactone hydrolase family protein [Planctomycetota bacterium]